MIKSIDHILVAVEDLDKAVEDYSLVFGFGPTWQGSHPSQGTKNALFPLENMYLELIGKEDEGPLGEFIGEHLKKNGESVFGLALETDDIEKAKKKLSLSFDTDLEISDGKGVNTISKKERHWKNILLPMSITRGIFTLLIEHTGGMPPVCSIRRVKIPLVMLIGKRMFFQCLSFFEIVFTPFPSEISKSVSKLNESFFLAFSMSSVSRAKPKTLSPFFFKCSPMNSPRGPSSSLPINSRYMFSRGNRAFFVPWDGWLPCQVGPKPKTSE